MSVRRLYATNETNGKQPLANGTEDSLTGRPHETHHDAELRVNHTHNNETPHSRSHSIFGHSHSNGVEAHTHDTEQIIAALEGKGDRGSQITLIGLVSNVGLTLAKGAAGWYLHSAALLADAGHSLSDLLGDFVTLFCWRLSRKPPSERYPYGFAKFETVGTTIISILLVGGALGIGFHSYHLLISALAETASTLPGGPWRELLFDITSVVPSAPGIARADVHTVDPNAAWFAAVGVLSKEWLYRITKAVADEEKSPVLLANAIHHRSDAYSSLVALFAILGTLVFPSIPLDPIGGLLVSIVILRQGLDLLLGAWGDLTDAGVSPKTRRSLERALNPLLSNSSLSFSKPALLDIRDIRARRSGSLMFVDLTASVSGQMNVHDASVLEVRITQALKEARKEITEVRIKFEPLDHNGDS
ncbi:CDF-like metal transporter [Tricholoma matsutake]|nr:CDF-like metal transporter [Tricholoma matsutake 945]